MKKNLLLTFLLCGVNIGLSAKTLVVYYSYTNKCHEIVTTLTDQIQADVMRIEPADKTQKYEENNYAIGTALLNAINAAPNDPSSYPAIDPVSITDLTPYQTIIIVTPLWWSKMAAIMQTYLFNYGAQMAGKDIGLIVSSYSSGIDGVVADCQRLVPDGNYLSENLWINNANHSNRTTMVQDWLVNTGLLAPLNTSKIAVVSDPHVMAPELLVSEGTAWTTYLNSQRKLVDYSKSLFDEMIRRIKQDIRPGLVLIPGDLTKDGEQVSHQYVTSKLDELRTLGIKTLVIPGNHDRGSNSNAVYYDGDNDPSPADVATNDWFAMQYANYGYGASSERETTTLTYACEPITGLVVIGIDSGTDGVLSETTLNWVVEEATEARTNGKKVIAMMHHPVIPHFTGVDNFVETAVVANYESVRNALADAGIRVVFTGHFHTSDIAMDKNAGLTKEIYDVNTGSLISYPCDYREVTISADLDELSITTGHMEDVLPKRINVTDGTHSVTFELNETSAAQSLYGMLPITKEVQNYSTNEKIFYPETAVSYGADYIEDDCPAGTLALFSPWGNVVMYYGAASKYTGLYVLGHAVEGGNQISELTGDITITQVGLAKERLRTAVINTISAKGTGYNLIAPTAAEAFIIHAEGDEAGNANAATVLNTLVTAANMGQGLIGADKAQALKDMATSMLQDKSQYDVDGRENVTNDLTLNIELPVTIKLAADGYSTYCSKNKLDITKSAGLTAYIISNVTETTVELQSVNVIPQETGFIVKGTGNALYDLFKGDAAADDVSGNQLIGTLTATSAPANTYALSTKKGVTGFYPVNTGLQIPAHKAYLTVSGSSQARALTLDGETTGILDIENQTYLFGGDFYNLSGQRVLAPTKGMYIVNGKKVMIK